MSASTDPQSQARLRIRAAPGKHESAVVGRHGDGWKVAVAAPADRGRANAELVRLLARVLGVRAADVTVVAGVTARDKLVAVDGLDAATAAARMDAACS